MKAKEAIERMRTVVKKEMTGDQAAEAQATAFTACAWEEFRRVVDLRFRHSENKVSIQSVKSLRVEYAAWGTCVARRSKLPWLKDNCGQIAFDFFFDAVAKASGGVVSIADLLKPDLAMGSRRVRGLPSTQGTPVTQGTPATQVVAPAPATQLPLPVDVEKAING